MAAGAALCVLLAVLGFALMRSQERVAPDIFPTAKRGRRRAERSILIRVADMVGRPFARPMMDLLGPWRLRIRRRIDAAGRPDNMTVESYARQTAGLIVIFLIPGVLFVLGGQLFLGVIVMCGVGQNELLLSVRIRQRQDEIERTLPDFLDVLAVTVSAGLGFRHALARVAESMPGALANEFTVALRQMELGTPRREAFEDLRQRNNAEALSQFVTAILQAEELGAPLSTALIDIGTDMRRESAQYAKRKAQRTTPRITAVSAVLTVPSIMAVVVGGMFYSSGADFGGFFR